MVFYCIFVLIKAPFADRVQEARDDAMPQAAALCTLSPDASSVPVLQGVDAMRATRARSASAGATFGKEPAAAAAPAPGRATAKAKQRSRVMEPSELASAPAPHGGEDAAARPDRDGGGADETLTAPRRSGRLVDQGFPEGAYAPAASIFPLPCTAGQQPLLQVAGSTRLPRRVEPVKQYTWSTCRLALAKYNGSLRSAQGTELTDVLASCVDAGRAIAAGQAAARGGAEEGAARAPRRRRVRCGAGWPRAERADRAGHVQQRRRVQQRQQQR